MLGHVEAQTIFGRWVLVKKKTCVGPRRLSQSLWQSAAQSPVELPAVTFNLLGNRRTKSFSNWSAGPERITGKRGLFQIENIYSLFFH